LIRRTDWIGAGKKEFGLKRLALMLALLVLPFPAGRMTT
jgi:hypothetical protein